MSYEIVKGIKIEDGKVFIKCDSNNVFPKDFKYHHSESLSKLLKEKGSKELDIEIMKEFESGNFQSSVNLKYTRALKVLFYVLKDEYVRFNWRNHNASYGSEEEKQERNLRDSQEFRDLLFKALNTKMPKEQYLIQKMYGERMVYINKVTKARATYTDDKTQAKEFQFKEECERVLKGYGITNGEVILK